MAKQQIRYKQVDDGQMDRFRWKWVTNGLMQRSLDKKRYKHIVEWTETIYEWTDE